MENKQLNWLVHYLLPLKQNTALSRFVVDATWRAFQLFLYLYVAIHISHVCSKHH